MGGQEGTLSSNVDGFLELRWNSEHIQLLNQTKIYL